MSFVKKLIGEHKPPPEWADFFSGEEYEAFLGLIHAYFQTQKTNISIQDGVLTVQEDGRQFGLQNLAQVCHMNDRKSWRENIKTHFDNIMKSESEQQELERKIDDFSEIRELLAVRIWPSDYLVKFDPPNIIYRQDMEGTVSVLAFDLPSSTVTVAADKAVHWNKDTRELFEIGLQYVRSKAIPNTTVENVGENLQITLLSGDSFYIATHALLLGEHPKCVGSHGSIVAIPHRHVVLCYPIEDINVVHAVNRLMPIVQGMYHEGPGSISPYLYWYNGSDYTNLPYTIEDKQLQFRPPESFVELLNGLAESTQK